VSTDALTVSAGRLRRPARPRLEAVDRSDAALMSIGTVASGLLAYAFNVVAARSLGPEAYGAIGALWAGMFLLAVLLFRPLEQTVSRAVADAVAHDLDARPVVRSAARMATVVAVAASVVLVALWPLITDGLFGGRDVLTLALVLGLAGYALSYFVRGICGGVRWFGGYGLLLLADGAVRVVVVLPLFFVASPAIAALAVAAAAWGGAVAPLFSRRRREAAARLDGGEEAPALRVGTASRFALPAVAIAGSEQVLVSGGPLLVLIAGGDNAARDAGVVFAATLLLRAPVFLFQGIQASLLPSLTTFQARGDHARAHHATVVTAAVLSGFSAAVALGALVAGPTAMSLLYGDGFEATATDLAVLALGVGGFLAAGTFCQALLARARSGLAALCWVTGAVVFVVVELTSGGAVMHRVAFAFAAGSLLAAGLMVTAVWGRRA
jgi:O-antigen/teichoic acid export membrane protein